MYVLLLDDDEINNVIMTQALHGLEGCETVSFLRPTEALSFGRVNTGKIGVAVTDWEMPEMNGLQFVHAARALPDFEHVPIVMVTSHRAQALKREALEAGVTDFLNKPIDAVEIRARITNLLALNAARLEQRDRAGWLAREVAAAVAVIEARELEIVSTLARAAEFRDKDTSDHLSRVATYVLFIAEGLGLPEDQCKSLSLASTMHDVGKIGLSDTILLKPGPLSRAERSEMKEHAVRGSRILSGSSSDLVRLAAEIAISHHERWDGQGYPHGLVGERIPLSGRIVAVADVFDALISERPYKKAWPLSEARTYVLENAGTQFDPSCVNAFLSRWQEIEAMFVISPPLQADPADLLSESTSAKSSGLHVGDSWASL